MNRTDLNNYNQLMPLTLSSTSTSVYIPVSSNLRTGNLKQNLLKATENLTEKSKEKVSE